MLHGCPDCGLLHEAGELRTAPEVEIAKIQADAQIRMAELQSRADRHVADAYAEADVESAKAEAHAVEAAMSDQEADEHVADAINAVAAGLDPVADAGPAPEPEPEVVIQDTQINDVPEPPKHEEHHAPSAPKKKGLGLW